MRGVEELLEEMQRLPVTDKWRLVMRMLQVLEQEQRELSEESDWHEFLRETYGSLRDTPLQRWSQGDYEEREPIL